jgi:hypothetical protein
MRQWQRCKRQWYFATYRRLVRQGAVNFNRPLGIGSRVHDALAVYYDPDKRIDPLEYLAQSIEADVLAHPAHETDVRKEGALAVAMMEGYVQWCEETGADVGMELLKAEGATEVELAPGLHLLTKMDAQVRMPDGSRLNLEHKTVGDLSTPIQALQLDTQCLTEHLAEYLELKLKGEEEDRAEGVLYNMLRKSKRTVRAKPPFYARVPVRHNIHELRSHWEHVMAIASEIVAAQAALDSGARHQAVAPPNPTRDCKWQCPFFQICPMLDDGSDVEQAIADLYVQGDPLARYDGLIDEEDE